MSIKITAGPGNSILKDVAHTDDIQDSWLEFLGVDVDNVEVHTYGRWIHPTVGECSKSPRVVSAPLNR